MTGTETVRPELRRLDGIDTLRGMSILAVILLHTWIRFFAASVRLGRFWGPLVSHFVFHNGGNGVTIFFAVSGFLITLTSLRRFGSLGAMRPMVFYRIRFARIVPLLLLLLTVLSAMHLAHLPEFIINPKVATLPRALFAALTFHLNWLETVRNGWLPPVWTVLWSLSIEEMFYLFFPIAAVVLMARWRAGIWAWLALGVLLITVGPWARVVWPKNDLAAENSYLAGMSDIAMGCIAAVVVERASRATRSLRRGWLVSLQVAGWAIILMIALWPSWTVLHTLGRSGTDDTLLALATCLLMTGVALRGKAGSRWTAPLRWFGRHSYELYLSHEFVVLAVIAIFAKHYRTPPSVKLNPAPHAVIATYVVAIVVFCAPLGWVLAKYFTEPLNRRLRGAAAPR